MATAGASNVAPNGGGMKKLVLSVAAVLVLLLIGIAVLLVLKKAPAEDEDGMEAPAPAISHAAPKPGTPPVFVPLDPFIVNLSDKEVDRFAQIGITLEVVDAKFADQLKAYMPAIRSNVLMVLSHKTSAELLTLDGKEKLAREIMRESVRPMGIELDDDEDEGDGAKKRKRRSRTVQSPVTQVLFSSFIVQ